MLSDNRPRQMELVKVINYIEDASMSMFLPAIEKVFKLKRVADKISGLTSYIVVGYDIEVEIDNDGEWVCFTYVPAGEEDYDQYTYEWPASMIFGSLTDVCNEILIKCGGEHEES